MREIKLLKFKEVCECMPIIPVSEGPLKHYLTDEEWNYIKDWNEVIYIEKFYIVISRFLKAIATKTKYEKR